MRQQHIIGVLVAVALLGAAGCGGDADPAADESRLVVAAESELGDLTSVDPLGNHIPLPFSLIHDPLLRRDGSGGLLPALATGWVQTDPRTWRFSLREDVTFHDGSDFDAADVAATVEYVIDPANSSGYLRFLRTVTEAAVVDPHTVDLITSVPNGLLPDYLNQVPMLSADQLTLGDGSHAEELLGTGPYELARWRPGELVEVTRYDDYWGEAGGYETVELRAVAEPATRLADLQTGNAQVIADLLPEQLPSVEAAGGEVVIEPAVKTAYLAFNQHGPLADPDVRRALYHAIDRESIVATVFEDLAEPAVGVVPAGFAGYAEAFPLSDHDPARARRLLADAGVDTPVAAEINTTAVMAPVAELVRAQAAEAGFDLTVVTLPGAQIFDTDRVNAGGQPRILLYTALDNRMGDAYRPLETFFGADAFVTAYGHRPEPAHEELLHEYLASRQHADRDRIAGEILATALDNLPAVLLYFPQTVFAIGQGTCYQPTDTGQFRIEAARPCPAG